MRGDRLAERRYAGERGVLVVSAAHRLCRRLDQLRRLAAVGEALPKVERTRALGQCGHRREDRLAHHRSLTTARWPPVILTVAGRPAVRYWCGRYLDPTVSDRS